MNQIRCHETRQNKTRLFSKLDYWIVKQGVGALPYLEKFAVELRFWRHYSIAEIAHVMEMSPAEVEGALSRAYDFLKLYCLSRSKFSRSVPLQVAA